MSKPDFSKTIILDGAMGTELQKRVLPAVRIPEEYALVCPEEIEAIHQSYIDAGANILYASTFGANPLHLDPLGLDLDTVIGSAVSIARKAAARTGALVALDIGPLGVLLEPMGSMSFEKAYENFARMVKSGVKAGADLIVIETMTDLYEVRAALLAAKENSSLPVFVTMTFEENGRTFAGATLESMVTLAESLKADAVGINCSLGPVQLAPLLKNLASLTNLPIIAKPNAGLPDPRTGVYHLSDDEFVDAARQYVEAGVSVLGGCCGTSPATIKKLSDAFAGRKIRERKTENRSSLCSAVRTVALDGIRIVGERINPTGKKRMQQALKEKDLDYIARLALQQQEAGADILDVNVGCPGVDEKEMMPAVIRKIQSVCDLPLLLDSSDPEALEAGLRVVNGRAAINSVNGKQESLDAILPLAARFGTPVVALCLDENGVPDSSEKRLEIARKIRDEAEKYGIPLEDLWFDALTLTVSAQQDQAQETLKTIEVISKEWGAPTILGVSNISFGLPDRLLMTRTFLNAALQAGLRFAIINPSQKELIDTIDAFRVLNGEDPSCRRYIEKHAHDSAGLAPSVSKEYSLQEAVIRGLEQEASRAASALLQEGKSELEIAENELIPALDIVGSEYEKGKLYLPSLLQAASAAQSVFEVLRDSMAKKGTKQASRGTVVLATVQGDVHDIGKNIVKTLLENYSYTVIDLGKDVDPQTIVQTVKENEIALVGLSALMTTTLPAMEKTVALLKELDLPPKIMVGGAVVTQNAADEMGADFYAKDARASVSYANEVFGYE